MSLPNTVTISTSLLTDLGDAVRERFGVSGDKTLTELKEIVLPSLPSEYQQVEYIESVGGNNAQFIKTGAIGVDGSEVDFQLLSDSNINNTQVMGCYRDDSQGRFWITTQNGYFRIVMGDSTHDWKNSIAVDTNRHKVKMGLVFGGTAYFDETNTGMTFGKSPNIDPYLFARNDHDTYAANPCGKLRLFYCKFFSGKSIVRYFIPCYRKSDNVIGLYDIINDQFYTNSGSGSFTCYPSPT